MRVFLGDQLGIILKRYYINRTASNLKLLITSCIRDNYLFIKWVDVVEQKKLHRISKSLLYVYMYVDK